jgi:hypothetical protein
MAGTIDESPEKPPPYPKSVKPVRPKSDGKPPPKTHDPPPPYEKKGKVSDKI